MVTNSLLVAPAERQIYPQRPGKSDVLGSRELRGDQVNVYFPLATHAG